MSFRQIVLLTLSLHLSSILGSATETAPPERNEATAVPEGSTVAAASSEDTPPELTRIYIDGGHFEGSPVRRGIRYYSHIAFKNCSSIGSLEAGCFSDQPHLRILNFQGSAVNFSTLMGGVFGRGCPALSVINLTDTKGVTIRSFIENLAAPELLDLIRSGTCRLMITRAPEHVRSAEDDSPSVTAPPSTAASRTRLTTTPSAASGRGRRDAVASWGSYTASAASRSAIELALTSLFEGLDSNSSTYTQEEINTIIDSFRETPPAAQTRSWWLRVLTLGYVGGTTE